LSEPDDGEGLFDAPTARARAGGGSLATAAHSGSPLAVRMRPRSLDELVGQEQLRAPGSPLRQLIEGDQSLSLLLWGPPGTGKTTIASILSQQTERAFVEVSAVSAGVKEVRAAIDAARARLVGGGGETVLFVDEVHRFSKAQQDALLPGVENRWVTLVAATTENPFFSVISPLLSRSLLLRLESLTDDDIRGVLARALADERGLGGRVEVEPDALDHLVRLAGGDARRSLTAPPGRGPRPVPPPRWSSTWRRRRPRWTRPRSATTARATSTTTSPARSSSRSGGPTRTPPCTTSPG
jgi:putative ATPase